MRVISCAIFFFLVSMGHRGKCQYMDAISSVIKSAEKDLDFNGVVLISKGDDILLHESYGHLDKKKTTTTNKNAIYNIASISKTFTGIAVVKLVEQGRFF